MLKGGARLKLIKPPPAGAKRTGSVPGNVIRALQSDQGGS